MSDNAESGEEDNRQSGCDRQRDGSESGQQQGASPAEKVVMVISIVTTVLLFAYAGWQIVTLPQAGTPEATVVETASIQNGSVAVMVQLRNPSDSGLITATMGANCTSPPAQVMFSYIPASSTRTGTLVCPAGTTDPFVSLANWVRS